MEGFWKFIAALLGSDDGRAALEKLKNGQSGIIIVELIEELINSGALTDDKAIRCQQYARLLAALDAKMKNDGIETTINLLGEKTRQAIIPTNSQTLKPHGWGIGEKELYKKYQWFRDRVKEEYINPIAQKLLETWGVYKPNDADGAIWAEFFFHVSTKVVTEPSFTEPTEIQDFLDLFEEFKGNQK
jgi:hypothetical protein